MVDQSELVSRVFLRQRNQDRPSCSLRMRMLSKCRQGHICTISPHETVAHGSVNTSSPLRFPFIHFSLWQAWRVLSRLHGSNLAYTPMIHSGLFANPSNTRYQQEQFDIATGEEGDAMLDRPLTAQFCSNDKDVFLAAATRLAESGKVDCVDLNLVRRRNRLHAKTCAAVVAPLNSPIR